MINGSIMTPVDQHVLSFDLDCCANRSSAIKDFFAVDDVLLLHILGERKTLVIPGPRNLLLRAGRFGNEADMNIAVKLGRAHEEFKSWQSSTGIRCSQPKFTEKMVS